MLSWDLGPCMKCKPCSMLYIKNWKTKQELRIFLLRVKPPSDSPPTPHPICNPAGICPKTGCLLLRKLLNSCRLFPTWNHKKTDSGQRKTTGILPLSPDPAIQCFSSSLDWEAQWAAMMSRLLTSRPKKPFWFSSLSKLVAQPPLPQLKKAVKEISQKFSILFGPYL